MPPAGFVNAHGLPVPWAAIAPTYRREDWTLPLPVLLAFAREPRDRPGDVRATELAGEIQQAILKRRHDYYTDPVEGMWAMVGTGVHHALEAALGSMGKASESESEVRAEVGGLIVGGRIDWVTDDELVDWKTMALYGAKLVYRNGVTKEKPDFIRQLTIYRALLALAGRPDPKRYTIAVLARDHRSYEAKKERDYPPPFFAAEAEVPPVDEAVRILKAAVEEWKDAVLRPASELPECKDLWKPRPDGLPTRCASYCQVNEFCSQFKRIKEGLRRNI